MATIYDDDRFFKRYSQMPRSQKGLAAAGEWPAFKTLLPDLKGKKVLDLGCGYGWHCRYAAAQGADCVVGVDISNKMLAQARQQTQDSQVTYIQSDIATFQSEQRFDVVLSSLALHYIQNFQQVVKRVRALLNQHGVFQFTIEHPIFTAEGHEEWIKAADGSLKYWPVDHYFAEGKRQTDFLGTTVTKYHHTLSTLIDGLLTNGFTLQRIAEPQPPEELRDLPEMQPSTRVPMMLIIKAQK
ncbi:class I SAM-dependent methyltransferase [Loigolactobacillus rennini]|uniref:Ubiquinone menaquinone biosynthesis methyltransferase ubie n=1 Tax=Loigolactobacillus rennini DSM 20253 TaxID=1423796 RepID=A0A0R2D7W7_9LACO|nr:class I SAM-dependent methyltransferase [Loigolactobacillus rennini]KRM99274.1 ubiquinone menaquinone biosynthesis methyltransferase ubie [Loigolactobacillus rennini DSM 20253]